MKKFLAILVLGLSLILLNSCGSSGFSYDQFRNQNPGYNYYAYACPSSNPYVIQDCGMAADISESIARQTALEWCGKKYIDCVVVKVNNKNVYQQSLNEIQSISLASMIDDAKNTCKDLGFTEGTDKFSDCSLKLYSQSVELAAKNKQQIVSTSSGGSITIYDPARDSRALIRQGQRMLRPGGCTLGINC